MVSNKWNRVLFLAEDDVILTVDVGLAYRDDLKSEWSTKFHSVEQQPLRCILTVPKVNLHDRISHAQIVCIHMSHMCNRNMVFADI